MEIVIAYLVVSVVAAVAYVAGMAAFNRGRRR